jgi:hypothetical protein
LPLLNSPIPDYEGPGRAFRPVLAEVIQFEFMRHWDCVMTAFCRGSGAMVAAGELVGTF